MKQATQIKRLKSRLVAAFRRRETETLRRYASGFSQTLLGTAISQVSTYTSIIIMARMLDVESFGRLGTIQATLSAVLGVSTLGIGITSTRYLTRYRVTDKARAGRIMGLCMLTSLCSGAVFSGILALFANVISIHLFHAGKLAMALRITAPYCALMTLNAHQLGALLGFQAYGRLLRAQVLRGATTLSLTAILVYSMGFGGAMLSLPLTASLAWLYMHRELSAECRNQGVRLTFRGAWTERRLLMGFALPASLSGVIGSFAIWCAQGMLIRAHGGMQEIGLWTSSGVFRSMVLVAPGILNRMSGPVLSSLHDHATGQAYRRTFWSTVAVATSCSAVTASIILLLGPFLLHTTFGDRYMRAESLLPLVVCSAVIEVYACSVYQAIVANARMVYQLTIIAAWGTALTLTAFLMVPSLLAKGLALSYLGAWILAAVGYTLIARQLLTVRGCGVLTLTSSPRQAIDSQAA